MKEHSVVGDLINFRGLVYSPMNENGVIFLFGKVMEDLNMYIEEIKPGFPDCTGRRFNGKGWEKIYIELFTGRGEIKNVEKRSKVYKKWGIFELENEKQLPDLLESVEASFKRMRTAIKNNKATSE